MAKKRGGGNSESGGSWIDTYADMVTLILCFFVLLYSMSNMEESKFQFIAQAFSSMGKVFNTVVAEQMNVKDPTGNLIEDAMLNSAESELPTTFDDPYNVLAQYITDTGLNDTVELEKGAAGITLKFRDNIFFEPDKAELLDTGKTLLSDLSPAFEAVDELILGIKVSGHTAKVPESPTDEWTLSSDRANNVLRYMMELDFCSVDKLSSSGYGGYRPVESNETEEGRRSNRRVEITIARNDVDYSDPTVLQEFLDMEYGKNKVNVMPTDAMGNIIYLDGMDEEKKPEETTAETDETTSDEQENPEETTSEDTTESAEGQ